MPNTGTVTTATAQDPWPSGVTISWWLYQRRGEGAEQEEIVRAIRTVASGGAVFGVTLARRIAEFFAAGPPTATTAFPELTAREREILELLAGGRSNQQIAQTVFLSQKTVRNNVSNVFAKLQVADRSEAIVRAREAGLGR
jgi:DNA-binding NarL/FixJ family response regulator